MSDIKLTPEQEKLKEAFEALPFEQKVMSSFEVVFALLRDIKMQNSAAIQNQALMLEKGIRPLKKNEKIINPTEDLITKV